MPDTGAENTFEKDLERLEEVVRALEGSDLPLDQALARFEEGVKLAKRCEGALTRAEKRIEILQKNASGEYEASPFGEDEEETPADAGRTPRKPATRPTRKRESAGSGEGEEPATTPDILF